MKITLYNPFRKTKVTIRPDVTEDPMVMSVSRKIRRKIKRELCGVKDCRWGQCKHNLEDHQNDAWEYLGIDEVDRALLKFKDGLPRRIESK